MPTIIRLNTSAVAAPIILVDESLDQVVSELREGDGWARVTQKGHVTFVNGANVAHVQEARTRRGLFASRSPR